MHLAVLGFVIGVATLANPSYMYQNSVLVGSTRGSSAFPTANTTLVYVGDPFGRGLLMILIVSISLNLPQVGQEGLLATGRVHLSDERSLV